MATLPRDIAVPCPECGEYVQVDIEVTSAQSGDSLVLTFAPNVDKMAEHYTLEHCGQEVNDE